MSGSPIVKRSSTTGLVPTLGIGRPPVSCVGQNMVFSFAAVSGTGCKEEVPMLDDLAVLEAEDVRGGGASVRGRGVEQAVRHDQVALGDGALDLEAGLRELGREAGQELDERLGPVGGLRVPSGSGARSRRSPAPARPCLAGWRRRGGGLVQALGFSGSASSPGRRARGARLISACEPAAGVRRDLSERAEPEPGEVTSSAALLSASAPLPKRPPRSCRAAGDRRTSRRSRFPRSRRRPAPASSGGLRGSGRRAPP